jgi:alpha-beta hydrolase superfamily lysophospholipase
VTVYAVDHRGFGRSGGLAGHIDSYRTFVEDSYEVITELRRRHPQARIYLLGHSMGGIFTTHIAARHGNDLAGILYLNPWVEDSSRVAPGRLLSILVGGMFKSKRAWKLGGGPEGMTTNPEAAALLNADPYWRRAQTASFLVQILSMRGAVLKLAKTITLPALVMQAEQDKAVLISGTRKLFDALASSDKTWKSYPDYAHDSEFEADRSQMDEDIAAWIGEHSSKVEERQAAS